MLTCAYSEGDTFLHSWEVLAEIISDRVCEGMLIDVGMGVRHRNVRYNTRVLCTYRNIFAIRYVVVPVSRPSLSG